jgi:TPR repeat protein
LAQNINGQKDDYRKTLEEGGRQREHKVRFILRRRAVKSGERLQKPFVITKLARFDEDPEAAFLYAMDFHWQEVWAGSTTKKCVDLLIKAAFSGSSEAAAHLGKSYLWGLIVCRGQKRDFSKAEFYLTMADETWTFGRRIFPWVSLYDGDYTGAEDFIDRKKSGRNSGKKLAKKGHADSLASVGDYYYHGYAGYKKESCYGSGLFILKPPNEEALKRQRNTPR